MKCESARSSRKLYAYASQTPLDVIRTFSCEVSEGSNTTSAKFCVISGEGDPLLWKDTATSLGILKIGIGIAAVTADPKTTGGILQQKYPDVFSSIGKLKDRAVQLHVDHVEAIRKARHPIPTVDEITQSISGSNVFSKLDLKWGYH